MDSKSGAIVIENNAAEIGAAARAINRFDKIEFFVGGVGLIGAIGILFMEVLARYFFKISTPWAEEMVRYFIIFAFFIGCSNLIKKEGHISIDILKNKFSTDTQKIFDMIHSVVGFVFAIGTTYGGIQMVSNALSIGLLSESQIRLPLAIPYSFVVIGGALMVFRWLERVVRHRVPLGVLIKNPMTYITVAVYIVLLLMVDAKVSAFAVLIVGMAFMMATGMPIAFAIGISSAMAVLAVGFGDFISIANRMYFSINSFTLLAIPFFILAGEILTSSNLGKSIFHLANLIFRNRIGGLGIAVMVASMFFAAISGSSVANCAAIGMIAFPMLAAAGYPNRFSGGILASGGTLAVIIPPSALLILYGSISLTSVRDLFLAGIVPGIIIGVALCIYIYIYCRVNKFETKSKELLTMQVFLAALKQSALAIVMPVLILGMIYSGITTPTESAAVASVYALLVVLLFYRDTKPRELPVMFGKANNLSSMIYAIIMMSGILGFIFSIEQIPQKFMELVLQLELSWWQLLIFINILVFAFGFFMGQAAILIIMVPTVLPAALVLGIDPVHLGILFVINMELAYLTPPVGSNLYIISRVGKMPVEQVIRGSLPFILILLACLFLMTFVPELSLMFIR